MCFLCIYIFLQTPPHLTIKLWIESALFLLLIPYITKHPQDALAMGYILYFLGLSFSNTQKHYLFNIQLKVTVISVNGSKSIN